MEKIIKSAGTLDKVLSVVRIIFIVLMAIAAVGLAVCVIAGDWIVAELNSGLAPITVQTGVFKYTAHISDFSASDFRAGCLSVIAMLVVLTAGLLYAISLLKGILGDMRDGQPFSPEIPRRIRRLAYMIFAYAFVMPTLKMIPEICVYQLTALDQLIASIPNAGSAEISLSYTVDGMMIFVGFVVLLLAYVFEYGTRLQRESDELL